MRLGSAVSWPFLSCSDEHGPNSAPYIVLGLISGTAISRDDPKVVGRVVQLNKHPFTIIGVAPPEFHGTLIMFSPDFFIPMVNQEQLDGCGYSWRSRRAADFHDDGTSETGSAPGAGDG